MSEQETAPQSASVPAAYFTRLYEEHVDPWNFATSSYEYEKYTATLDALPRERYRSAFEIACSIGVFTARLADRCDALLAVDVAEPALERARERCRNLRHVRFARMEIPRDYPDQRFELTTFCEVGFYLARSELLLARDRIVAGTEDGGHIILVHWTPPVKGHASTAEEVHEAFHEAPLLRHLHGFSASTYRLDVFERVSPPSARHSTRRRSA
jgi:SAM-dependent methyltransferase